MRKDIKGITRRDFLAAGAAAVTISGFPFVHTSRAQDVRPLKIGVIGCGGRGRGAATNAIKSAPNIHLTALSDLVPDRIKETREYFAKGSKREGPTPNIDVTDKTCFSGFDGYKKLLDTDIDYVILTGPPGLRYRHFAAAIDAGKHVFIEKPVAVDPVAIRSILATGEKAKRKGLSVVAGTQRRHQKSYLETIKRIHDGQIGEVVAAQIYWNGSALWHRGNKPEWSEMEYQCRNWYYFCWLSGDHIVEQHLHNFDVANWIIGTHPISAMGVGGRQVRTDPKYGNIYDHFAIDYEYPNNVHVMSMCRQYSGDYDTKIGEFIIGTKGKADPQGEIFGQNAWKFEDKEPNPYEQEHADLIESIRKNKPVNETKNVAYSTLTAIMGRESAYTGKNITWEEIMNSDLDLKPDGYSMDTKPPNRPVPMPGQPRPR